MIRIPVDITDAFDHLFVLGLAAIIEAERGEAVRLHWATRREVVLSSSDDLVPQDLGDIVRNHLHRHVESDWLTTTGELAGGKRSPLSPRLGKLTDAEDFARLEQARRPLIDSLEPADWLTHRFLGALGRPIDWAVNDKSEIVPDRGASAWEMKTRNRGEEFVQNRLAKLARSLDHRTASQVLDGLLGRTVRDESGKDALDSRTPTGLRAPGPTDGARAWAALWGISAFPVQPVAGQTDPGRQASTTAGALRLTGGRVWFVLPIIDAPKTLAAVRAVIRSAPLARQALLALRRSLPAERNTTARDFEWLQEHKVTRLVLFERAKSDNPNAPELYALPGRTVETVQIPRVAVSNRSRANRSSGDDSRGQSQSVSQLGIY